jgi:hypothetical protein
VENALLERGKFPPVVVGHDEARSVTGCDFLGNAGSNAGSIDAETDGFRRTNFTNIRAHRVVEQFGILSSVSAGADVSRYDYGCGLLEQLNSLAGGVSHFAFSVFMLDTWRGPFCPSSFRISVACSRQMMMGDNERTRKMEDGRLILNNG